MATSSSSVVGDEKKVTMSHTMTQQGPNFGSQDVRNRRIGGDTPYRDDPVSSHLLGGWVMKTKEGISQQVFVCLFICRLHPSIWNPSEMEDMGHHQWLPLTRIIKNPWPALLTRVGCPIVVPPVACCKRKDPTVAITEMISTTCLGLVAWGHRMIMGFGPIDTIPRGPSWP